MDDLSVVIGFLDESEVAEFRLYLQRNKFKKNRKDLRLFNLLHSGVAMSGQEFLASLNLGNLNAYHTLRKRLYSELSAFLLDFEKRENEKYERVLNYINLAKHLFQREAHKLASKFLRKANKYGIENRFYALLQEAYMLEFEYFNVGSSRTFPELEDVFLKNKEMILVKEKVAISKSRISALVSKSKLAGIPFDLFPVLEKEIAEQGLGVALEESPEILLDYLITIKKTAQVSKSYAGLEKLLETYIEKVYLTTSDSVKVELNYLIAHTKYRNKKFEESYNIAQQTRFMLTNCSKSVNRKYGLRFKTLICANLVFLGRIEDSISALKPELSNTQVSLKERTNLTVILGIYNFLAEKREDSLKLLLELKHSEKWYAKEMGREWVFKKNLMEIILYFDLEKDDIALNRLRSLERRFKEFLQLKAYKRAGIFLKLLKEFILKNPDSQAFRTQIEESWNWIPAEDEDLQAMLFYCWLKSKINQTVFYKEVLNTVNPVKD